MTVQTLIVASMAVMQQSPTPDIHVPMFSDCERQEVVAYWSEPGRYTVGPFIDPKLGAWAVRLPADASQWFWNYNRARGYGKTPPSQVPPALNAEQETWEAWINEKVAYDRWAAGKEAEKKNLEDYGLKTLLGETIEPPCPNSMPKKLESLVGKAPAFAICVKPQQHIIRFDEQFSITLQDFPAVSVRYAYFRYPQGVMSIGTPMRVIPKDEVQKLFKDAGVSDSERRVMNAVSVLEGGFDSVNTYDTGFVSVGCIQFACLKSGSGSLGSMLLSYKTASPKDFDGDFRRFGIEVDAKGFLTVVHPVSGNELVGTEAAMTIIQEPRLIAVFQRAGQLSRPFRIAQVKAARSMFYPGNDVVTFALGSKTVSAKVKDIVKTEAGMATLMDRKVNTGHLDPLPLVISRVAAEYRVKSVADLSKYEFDITNSMKYRRDYLAEVNLSQPDRHGKPGSRKR